MYFIPYVHVAEKSRRFCEHHKNNHQVERAAFPQEHLHPFREMDDDELPFNGKKCFELGKARVVASVKMTSVVKTGDRVSSAALAALKRRLERRL